MRNTAEVAQLLDRLEQQPARDLESQDLDFKEWKRRSLADAVKLVVEAVICMANGGGGTVVFGVSDKAVGRSRAILGVPPEIDVNRLKKAVYDGTDPKVTPVFDELRVPEGTGRVLVMQVHPGLPPYTDTSGRGTVRVGRDCMPLTGSLRGKIAVETGASDYSAEPVAPLVSGLISPTAMEQLRDAARRERAPEQLLGRGDAELLGGLGLVRNGQVTRAALLLAGTPAALREHAPAYTWTHLRMRTDTEYTDRADGNDAISVALGRVMDRIMADNPIATVRQGLFHFEYRTYPEAALREALMNAFCHADYRLASPVMVKQSTERLEISNPGGFIGGISPENILHHAPVSRNPSLVDALVRLRLVNRSNLGVARIYTALLIEGKEPPLIEDLGGVVRVSLRSSDLSVPFREFVAEQEQQGRWLSVDHLLILQHLLRHPELETGTASRICQRPEAEARELLSALERDFDLVERGGAGRGTYWTLRPDLHRRLHAPGHPERDERIDWEAAKTRVLSVLKRRAERGEPGLSNAEIRAIAHLSRAQVKRLMDELRAEGQAGTLGERRGARWVWLAGQR